MNDFSTARVGDRLYVRLSHLEGWCEVINTNYNGGIGFPIQGVLDITSDINGKYDWVGPVQTVEVEVYE